MVERINLKSCIKSIQSGSRAKGGAIECGIPSLGAEHLNNCGGFNLAKEKLKYVSEDFFASMKTGIIHKNDVIVVKDGATTGKVSYVDDTFPLCKAAINEHVFILRTTHQLLPKYLFYYCFSDVGQRMILQDFRGATVGGISKNFINIPIPLPPLETQQKIADILDKASSLIELRKAQIEKLDLLVKSKFIDMFGDPVTNPMGWEVRKLGEACDKITDGKHGDCQDQYNSGYYFLSAKDINNGLLKYSGAREITKKDFVESDKRTMLQKNDLVIVNTGATIGKTALILDNSLVRFTTFQKSVAIISTRSNVLLSRYLQQYVIEERNNIYAEASGSAQKNWLLSQMRNYKIMIPPLPLQTQFADFVEQVEQQKAVLNQSLEKLELNYKSLMQGCFSGKLL